MHLVTPIDCHVKNELNCMGPLHDDGYLEHGEYLVFEKKTSAHPIHLSAGLTLSVRCMKHEAQLHFYCDSKTTG